MSTSLSLSIYSPERKLLEGLEVSEVVLPTSEGQIQVLPGHVDFLGAIEAGEFRFKDVPQGGGQSQEGTGFFSNGFFEITGSRVVVTAEVLELGDEIDLERAKRAQANAEQALTGANLDEHQFNKYQLKLQRSIIRQQIGTRK